MSDRYRLPQSAHPFSRRQSQSIHWTVYTSPDTVFLFYSSPNQSQYDSQPYFLPTFLLTYFTIKVSDLHYFPFPKIWLYLSFSSTIYCIFSCFSTFLLKIYKTSFPKLVLFLAKSLEIIYVFILFYAYAIIYR